MRTGIPLYDEIPPDRVENCWENKRKNSMKKVLTFAGAYNIIYLASGKNA